jgi:hypothetical protein
VLITPLQGVPPCRTSQKTQESTIWTVFANKGAHLFSQSVPNIESSVGSLCENKCVPFVFPQAEYLPEIATRCPTSTEHVVTWESAIATVVKPS